MDNLITTLATQVPDLAALLLIVFVFVRYLEKRDRIIEQFTAQISRELKALSNATAIHAREMTDAIADMHRSVKNIHDH